MNARPEARSAIRNRSRDEKYPEIEDRYRLIAENSIDVIWQMDLRLRFTYVSPAIFPMTGYTPEEWVGTKLSEHAKGDDFWKMARQALKAIKNYKKFDHIVFEANMLRKDGSSIPVEINSKLILGEKGVPIGIQGSTRDISERKRIQENLVRRNAFLSALQETTLELLSQVGLQDLLENIVRRATALVGTKSGYLELVDSETGQLKPQVGLGALAESLQFEVGAGEGVAGTVWQTGKPLIVNDYDSWENRVDEFSRGTLSAVIGVPLVSNGQVVGVLGLAHEFGARRVFGQEEVEVLTQFARLAAIAIENARLFLTLQHELDERRETEAILKESERRLSTLMGNLLGMAYRCKNDVDWTMEFVSEGCSQLTGYKQEDLVGNAFLSFREVIHPDDRQMVWDGIQAAIKKKEKFQLTYRIRTAHAEEKWVLEKGQSIFVDDSENPMLEGFITDISKRKQAENLISSRLELLEYSTSHTIAEVLQKTLDLIGELTDSPIGFYHFVEPDEKTLSLQAWSTRTEKDFCMAEGRGLHYPIDQAGVWVECVKVRKPVIHNDYASLPNRKGLPERHAPVDRELVVPIFRSEKIVAILGVGNKPSEYTQEDTNLVTYFADVAWEIVERKRAEDRLVASEERFRRLAENAQDLIYRYELHPEPRFSYVSPASTTITGFTPEDHYADPQLGYKLVHPDDRHLLDEVKGGEDLKPLVLRWIHKNGNILWTEQRNVPVFDKHGTLIALEGIARDITERKQAELAIAKHSEELQRSNDDLQQFAYVISHDLQEPLRMVSSYLQLLEQRYKGSLGQDADEFIQFAVDGATRMQQLIMGLLAWSRVGTRGKELVPVRAEDVLTAALHNLSISIRETGATVTHDELPVVLADRSQFIQLFQNLIGNAVKFHSDEPVKVHVGVKQAKGPDGEPMWQFSVSDTGIGIDPQYFEHIFVIFQRLHAKDGYPGTGMGLSISKRIVERHEGRIWIESQPGEGSTFYFTLPIML